jgi:hypothetical protein
MSLVLQCLQKGSPKFPPAVQMLRDLSMSAAGKLHRSNNDCCGCRLWAVSDILHKGGKRPFAAVCTEVRCAGQSANSQ